MTESDLHLSFWEHVEDFRRTLLKILCTLGIGTILAIYFYPQIFSALSQTLEEELVLLSPTEGLTTIFKTGFWVGLFATSPIWLYFLLQFAAPGIRQKERRIIFPFFAISLAMMAAGTAFSLYATIPLANTYLGQLNRTIGLNFWSLSHYVNYTLVLLCSTAIAFESCTILFFLVHYGMISAEAMRAKRKAMIVAIFIASAILTPPDVVTQLLLAIPLMLFYEAAILYAKVRNRNSERRS